MNLKEYRIVSYLLDRLAEQSTWQGIGFLIGAFGGQRFANLDWGQAALVGGGVSALLKMLLPDPKGLQ